MPGSMSLPVSGTLFQYVVSVVSRDDAPGDITRFTIIPSRELSEFYDLRSIPQPFVFDGTASRSPITGESSSDEPAAEGPAASSDTAATPTDTPLAREDEFGHLHQRKLPGDERGREPDRDPEHQHDRDPER